MKGCKRSVRGGRTNEFYLSRCHDTERASKHHGKINNDVTHATGSPYRSENPNSVIKIDCNGRSEFKSASVCNKHLRMSRWIASLLIQAHCMVYGLF